MMRVVAFLLLPMVAVHFLFACADRDAIAKAGSEIEELATDKEIKEVVVLSDSCAMPPSLSNTNVWRGLFEIPLWMQSFSDESQAHHKYLFYIVGGPYSSTPETDCTELPAAELGPNPARGNTAVCRMRTGIGVKLITNLATEKVELVRGTSNEHCIVTGTGCDFHSTNLDSVIVAILGNPIAVSVAAVSDFPKAAKNIRDITQVVRYIEPMFHPSGGEKYHNRFVVHVVRLPSGKEKWYAVAVMNEGDGLCYIDRMFACQWESSFATFGQALPSKGRWYGYTEPGRMGEECSFGEGS